MPTAATLEITDGTTTIKLLTTSGKSSGGIFLLSWKPAVATGKDGGVWQSSPFVAGQRLVHHVYGAADESFEVALRANNTDGLAEQEQALERMLIKARSYWLSHWSDEPVWIKARVAGETGYRYALILDGVFTETLSPISQPFLQGCAKRVDAGILVLRRLHWMNLPPGSVQPLDIDAQELVVPASTFITSTPEQSAYDVWVQGSDFHLAEGAGMLYKDWADPFNDGVVGVVFPAVNIPPGATILGAHLDIVGNSTECNVGLNNRVYIWVENSGDAQPFSTIGDFNARSYLNAVHWDTAQWFESVLYTSASLTAEIQQIVARGDWDSNHSIGAKLAISGDGGPQRRCLALFDDPAYPAPVLHIQYTTDPAINYVSPAEDYVFIGNQGTPAEITHIFNHDGASYSDNLTGVIPPFELFPHDPPQAGDSLYFISDDQYLPGWGVPDENHGPFSSLVLNIAAGAHSLYGAWQYWNGSAWAPLRTSRVSEPTETEIIAAGTNHIYWDSPADWAITTVNGIGGHAVRYVVTGIWAAGTTLRQQKYTPYTVTAPYVSVAAAQIGGDIPALCELLIHNTSAANSALTFDSTERVIIGARSYDRGPDFGAFHPIGQVRPVGGFCMLPGGEHMLEVADPTAPGGIKARYTPVASPEALGWRIYGKLPNTAAIDGYRGQFRAFVRCRQSGGVAGDFVLRYKLLFGGTETVGDYRYTTSATEGPLLIDLGVVTFGSESVQGLPPPDNALIGVEIGNLSTTALPTLDIYDFIMLPADEWLGDFIANAVSPLALGALASGRYLRIDSAETQKTVCRAVCHQQSQLYIDTWRAETPGQFMLAPNTQHRLWFLSAHTGATPSVWISEIEATYRVQLFAVQQYLRYRGAR